MAKKITLLDYENDRVITAEIPQFILDAAEKNTDIDVAQTVLDALGLSSGNTEYMIGNDETQYVMLTRLEDLVQNFTIDAQESISQQTS